jgi:hypothetical protein
MSDARDRVRQAITELRQLRCADPAAEQALEAVRSAAYTLELWWLPTLDRTIGVSDSGL